MDNNEIIDPEIKNWIENYDYHIDAKACSELAEQYSIETCNQLLNSIIKKVGVIEGVRKANDILKSVLNIDTEIEVTPLVKEINNLNELELKLLALQTSNLTPDTKKQIIESYINNASIKEIKTPTVTDLLKQEIDKVYRNLGELPSNDINSVRRVKDVNTYKVKPFGRKNKK